MEVHFTPETEKRLKDLAAQSGRGTDDLVEDAMAGYVDELLQAREMLNSSPRVMAAILGGRE